MEIVVGKLSGFCFGVNNAVKKTTELLKKQNKIYCLGELAHNKGVIEDLENRGLLTIENVNESPRESKLIIRAHGIPPEIYKLAKKNKNKVYDFTCPLVLKVHKEVKRKSKKNYILIMGIKDHPEIIGTKGFSGENSYVIQTEEDIDEAISRFKKSNIKKLYIVAQTTFSVANFDKYLNEIYKKLESYDCHIEVNKSICDSTRMRQEETERISKDVNYMVIIGGQNSANTKKLYDIAKQNCTSIHIQNKEQINLEEIKKYKKIGVTAGASTPKEKVEEIVEFLKNTDCEERE